MTRFGTVDVQGHEVFYREAGERGRPTILLLHGFPSSSHMFRDLIPRLAGHLHVIAPDLPGFGFTVTPESLGFEFRFESLADVVEGFVDALGLERFALYVFDYGAPVGLRLALRRSAQVTAIVSQNGNAYAEGLSEAWNPIRAYWESPTQARREALRMLLTPETTRWQYTQGVSDPALVAPESYTLDACLLARPGNSAAQLDLFRDYPSNVAMYPAFQDYFRRHRPRLLAAWGRNDPFFLPEGAHAFRRDLPKAVVRLYDTGHFALETHAEPIAAEILALLA